MELISVRGRWNTWGGIRTVMIYNLLYNGEVCLCVCHGGKIILAGGKIILAGGKIILAVQVGKLGRGKIFLGMW